MATRTSRAVQPHDVLVVGEIDIESAKEFHFKLRDDDEEFPVKVPFRVVIACEGGDVELSLSIMSQIHEFRRRGRRIDTHVAGHAYSMASLILQAGEKRTIDRFGSIMIHKTWIDASGFKKAREFDSFREQMEYLNEVLIHTLKERSGQDEDDIRQLFIERDNYISPDVALTYNFVDEILTAP